MIPVIFPADELIIDNFAGGGGASCGIEMALGRSPDIAINHDPEAVAMHKANHPNTRHYCKSIYQVDPDDIMREYKRRIGFAWFSPDCTHHSKARGGKPKEKHIRDLAWVVVHWAERAVYKGQRIRCIGVENVEEFLDWTDLLENGQPNPETKGSEFWRWFNAMKKLGYKGEYKILHAHHYGAPTIRKRLVVIFRCDGQPIVWPEATHGPGLIPYRTAAECIDWSIPCPSIFERKRPLAENTLRRIARGIQRFVIDSPSPFIVNLTHHGADRVEDLDEPFRTITGAQRGEKALVTPVFSKPEFHCESCGYDFNDKYATGIDTLAPAECPACGEEKLILPFIVNMAHRGKLEAPDKPISTIATEKGGCRALVTPILVGAGGPAYSGKPRTADAPMHTLTNENHSALVAPTLIQVGYGERDGQAPRAPGLDKPLGTVVAGGGKHALVAAFLAQHNSDKNGHVRAGREATEPVSTITTTGHQQRLVASHLIKFKGTCRDGQPVTEPLATVQAQGLHHAEVRAFLIKYYSNGGQDQTLTDPMHTLTGKARMGLVTVHGEEYVIADIGMRMLAARELYRAQGFHDRYIIDPTFNGKPLTKTAQVRMCGNSVCPPMAQAVARALFSPSDVAEIKPVKLTRKSNFTSEQGVMI